MVGNGSQGVVSGGGLSLPSQMLEEDSAGVEQWTGARYLCQKSPVILDVLRRVSPVVSDDF